ncbi:pilus assembly protein TadG-related protein [Limibacillus sp. MBR-115]|uniref:pilus assembly protein TadG-related protein n=1 Tax=Limibacillus sp. MBR-115 TaxID=3156465 RepID=UPI0033939631
MVTKNPNEPRTYPRSLARRFLRGDGGMVLIWVTVLLPVLLGIAALAIDASYIFSNRSRAQAAADAAALAGSYLVDGGTQKEVEDAGFAAARANLAIGGGSGINIDSIVIERGVWDCSGIVYPATCFTVTGTDPTAVRASVSLGDGGASTVQLFFAKAIGFGDQEINVDAVANVIGGGPPQDCVVALNEHDAAAFYMNGNNDINATDCNIQIASDHPTAAAEINGGASNITITGGTFNVDGAYSGKTGVVNPEPVEGAGCAPNCNPYSGLNPIHELLQDIAYAPAGGSYDQVSPPSGFQCTSGSVGSPTAITGGTALTPGVYCGGITDFGSGTATMAPGTYVMLDGPLDTNAVILDGTAGVTIVMVDTGGDADSYVSSSGNAGFNLTAPDAASGSPFGGFIIWEAITNPKSADPNDWKISGTPNSDLIGAIYTPNAWWSFRGDVNQGAGGADCFLVISDKLDFRGGTQTDFSAAGCGGFGGTPLFTDDRYALVQ